MSILTANLKHLYQRRIDWLFYPKPKLAFSFFTGTIFGLLIYAFFISGLLQKSTNGYSNLTGTIGVKESTDIQNIASVPISLSEVSGDINVRQHDRFVWFDINLQTANELEILLEFEENTFNFKNYNNDPNIQTGHSFVKTKLILGEHLHIFLLKQVDPTTPIIVQLILSDELLFSKDIEIN